MPKEKLYSIEMLVDGQTVWIKPFFDLLKVDQILTGYSDTIKIIKEAEEHLQEDFGNKKVEIKIINYGNKEEPLELPILYAKDADVLNVHDTDEEFRKHLNNPSFVIDFIIDLIKFYDQEELRKLRFCILSIVKNISGNYLSSLELLLENVSGYMIDRIKYMCLTNHNNECNLKRIKQKEEESLQRKEEITLYLKDPEKVDAALRNYCLDFLNSLGIEHYNLSSPSELDFCDEEEALDIKETKKKSYEKIINVWSYGNNK